MLYANLINSKLGKLCLEKSNLSSTYQHCRQKLIILDNLNKGFESWMKAMTLFFNWSFTVERGDGDLRGTSSRGKSLPWSTA